MKTIKNLTFAALLATLLLQPSRASADAPAPILLTFEKSRVPGPGPVPYRFHFDGSFGGDFTGTLFTGVLVAVPIDEPRQIFHLEADYVLADGEGNHLLTAHVQGNQNNHTRQAVLNGVVTDGAFQGAQVHVEFDVLGGGRFQGTIRILPASAD